MSIQGKAIAVLADLRAAGVTKDRISIGQGKGFQAWTWEQVAPALGRAFDAHGVRQVVQPVSMELHGNSIWCHVHVYLYDADSDDDSPSDTACMIGSAWGDATANAGPSAAMTAATRHAWTLAAALAEPDPLHKRNDPDPEPDAEQPKPSHVDKARREAKQKVYIAAGEDEKLALEVWDVHCGNGKWKKEANLARAMAEAAARSTGEDPFL